MKRPTTVRGILLGHLVLWLIGCIFMALFIPDTFNWLVHPWGIAIPIAIAAVLRSLRLRRQQRAAALTSS